MTMAHAHAAHPAEPYLLGIDEAGRGPVLGPMVYACAYCPIARQTELARLGFADSKTLTPAQRDTLYERIEQASMWLHAERDVITARDISCKMLRRRKISLNEISHTSAAGLIQTAIEKGFWIKEVYVDTVGDPASYQKKLSAAFPNIDFRVEKKADSRFPIVSAASIVAKVTRDRCIEEWQARRNGSRHTPSSLASISENRNDDRVSSASSFSASTSDGNVDGDDDRVDDDDHDDANDDDEVREVAPPSKRRNTASSSAPTSSPSTSSSSTSLVTALGSGYPADPLTKQWLQGNCDPVFGFDELVRFSWSTTSKLMDERGVGLLWHDALDPEADNDKDNESRIEAFSARRKTLSVPCPAASVGSVSRRQAKIALLQRPRFIAQHGLHVATSMT